VILGTAAGLLPIVGLGCCALSALQDKRAFNRYSRNLEVSHPVKVCASSYNSVASISGSTVVDIRDKGSRPPGPLQCMYDAKVLSCQSAVLSVEQCTSGYVSAANQAISTCMHLQGQQSAVSLRSQMLMLPMAGRY